MLNKEKYAEKIIEIALSANGVALDKSTNKLVSCGSLNHCIDCKFSTEFGDCSTEKMQEWANAEYKEPILDKVEREYLSAFCRPYKIVTIRKRLSVNAGSQRLDICIDNALLGGYEYIRLPYFEDNTMYKGMELGKEYTPQELGITCKNNPNGEIKHD